MQEETGWKVIHNDVFREPWHANWLAVFVGSGSQLLGMAFITLLFALLGLCDIYLPFDPPPPPLHLLVIYGSRK